MSSIDYTLMTDQELRHYFLEHREDKAALKAYIERRQAHSQLITTVDDPDFDAKIQAAVRQQINKHQG